MMAGHILVALVKIPAFLLIELPIQFAGLFINAVTIPFRRLDGDMSNDGEPRQYTQFPEHGRWNRWRLPRWALWWDNPYDGLTGDKRGWWANECRKHGRTEHDFISMYIWSAIRNPANYFSRLIAGCDVSRCVISKLAGNTDVVDDTGASGASWHFLVATDDKGRRFHRLYGVWPIFGRWLYINAGWKIKLDHNGTLPNQREQDRFKGNTIRARLFDPAKS
jgi:hypothetical protein